MATSDELVTKPPAKDITIQPKIPYGYCHCGCYRKTTIADRNSKRDRMVKGVPRLFIPGHNWSALRSPSPPVRIDGKMYPTIPLGKGFVAIVDWRDFRRLSKFRWGMHEGNTIVYAARIAFTLDGKRYRIEMHNEIMRSPKRTIDHWNGNGIDNRRCNLRRVPQKYFHSVNQFNKKRQKNNISGFIGVSFRKNRGTWVARIQMFNRTLRIGSFKTSEEAARARDEAAKRYHGDFAKLNFPI